MIQCNRSQAEREKVLEAMKSRNVKVAIVEDESFPVYSIVDIGSGHFTVPVSLIRRYEAICKDYAKVQDELQEIFNNQLNQGGKKQHGNVR